MDVISILHTDSNTIPSWVYVKYPELRSISPSMQTTKKFTVRNYELKDEDLTIRVYSPLTKKEEELCHV